MLFNIDMEKKLTKFLFWFWPAFLSFLAAVLMFVNHKSGTWLTGWDTLHPEFNFPLNLMRVLFGVWREDQGVGAIAAHSHMAELPRILILWLFSSVLPLDMLRYLWMGLGLLFGLLGMYFLVYELMIAKKNEIASQVGGFSAALFYLFNLGTVQHFFVPFEMFPAAYAGTPWLFLLVNKYINSGKRSWLIVCFFVAFLSSPMAYAATLWYATFLGLILFVFGLAALKQKDYLMRGVLVLSLIVVANLYWILPNVYFLKNGSSVVTEAKTNRVFSGEAYLYNKSFGNMGDAMVFRNFLFDWAVFDFDNSQFVPMMSVWVDHLKLPFVYQIGVLGFVLSVTGYFCAFICRKRIVLALLPVGGLALLMLINSNPPFDSLFSWLRDNVSLFREGLRFPFTKFSILWMMVVAAGFGVFWNYVVVIFSRLKIGFFVGMLSSFLVLVGLSYYSLPMFSGNLISQRVQKQIPQAYFDLNEYMKDKGGRLAVLPAQSMWGWEYFDWGFQGAGFVWFGLPQSVAVRDFDRWSPYNEGMYLELSRGIYAKDASQIARVLDKYRISWLLLDRSIVAPGNDSDLLFRDEIVRLLSKIEGVNLVKDFGEKLAVYSVNRNIEKSVWSPDKYSLVEANTDYVREDKVYEAVGDYVGVSTGKRRIFPFADLAREEISGIEFGEDSLVLKRPVGDIYGENEWAAGDASMSGVVKLELDGGKNLVTAEESFGELGSASESWIMARGLSGSVNCDLFERGETEKGLGFSRVHYKAGDGGAVCDSFDYPELNYGDAFLLRMRGVNKSGRGIKSYLFNRDYDKPVLETLLTGDNFDNSFLLLPEENYIGSGYSLNLEAKSIGNVPAESELSEILWVRFPYDYLSGISIKPSDDDYVVENNVLVDGVEKWGTSHYLARIQLENSARDGLIVLSQGYESGWIAYATKPEITNSKLQITKFLKVIVPWFFGEKLTQVKVNGWANGFLLNSKPEISNDKEESDSIATLENDNAEEMEVVIVYWPQYLQWGGFGFLVIGSLFLVFWPRKKKHFYDPILDRIHHIKIPNINLLKKKLHLD